MNNYAAKKRYSIFQPTNGKKYWVRFSIKGQGQQRFPLDTYDLEEAEERALDVWYDKTSLAKAGLSVTNKKFETITKEFILYLQKEVAAGIRDEYQLRQYPAIIKNHFNVFFGDKSMSAIKVGDIEEYWTWRMGQPTSRKIKEIKPNPFVDRTKMPSKSTLNKEAMLMRQLFNFALNRQYVLDIPKIKVNASKKRQNNEKPGFTLKQFYKLMEVSERRVEAASEENDQLKLYIKRAKLHCYCMIAGYTGMRATELKNLVWQDIGQQVQELENGQEYQTPIIAARGKGKEREFVPMPEVMNYIEILRGLFLLEVGREPEDTDPVFSNKKGKPVQSFRKGLASLLEAANLRYTTDNPPRKRDSGSFRPFYISQQIREGVHPHILIRNVGTSGDMVIKHYNKILPIEEIPKLTKDWSRNRAFDVIMKDKKKNL